MTLTRPARRLLLVHAHPDDESITTGATMARYVAEGAQVTLVTCTLGEEGEILVPELAQLEAGHADQLGGVRIAELARAMRRLGVSDHRFLGGAGRFRDSGMMGTAANTKPRAFWNAARDPTIFQAAVDALVDLIGQVQPHVVITYDDFGSYGHPDHIMAHRVCTEAVQAVGTTQHPWQVSKLYWTAAPKSVLARHLTELRGDDSHHFVPPDSVAEVDFAVEDCLVSTAIDATAYLPAKLAALAEHATQINVHGHFFALSNGIGQRTDGVEYFRLVQGQLAGDTAADGRETDLFAGIDLLQ